jgi:hypothetical protein
MLSTGRLFSFNSKNITTNLFFHSFMLAHLFNAQEAWSVRGKLVCALLIFTNVQGQASTITTLSRNEVKASRSPNAGETFSQVRHSRFKVPRPVLELSAVEAPTLSPLTRLSISSPVNRCW